MVGAALFVAFLAVPIVVVLVDILGQLRGRRRQRNCFRIEADTVACADFTVVVPVWGQMSYLKNEEYLSRYGSRVLLVTSSEETPEFFSQFFALADEYGFRTHVATPPQHSTDGTGRRQVGGTMRDSLVRDAHEAISSPYVVCIDADTITSEPLDLLVGRFVEIGVDIASVRLIAANSDTLLAHLQVHEYRMAMLLRRVVPWMLSGACHIAKREVHKDLMRRHSMFFQGNDIELGLLAEARGYHVGHILFDVPTEVPSHLHPWWRQRSAWAAGVFRIMVVNIRIGWRNPFVFAYCAVVIALAPARYYYLAHPSLTLGVQLAASVAVYYVAILAINWQYRNRALLVYPLYSLAYTMVLIPVGIVTYFRMARAYRNYGIIRPNRSRPVGAPDHRRRADSPPAVGELRSPVSVD